jgi:hypothetical protein
MTIPIVEHDERMQAWEYATFEGRPAMVVDGGGEGDG